MKTKLCKYLIFLSLCMVHEVQAVNYVDLDAYKGYHTRTQKRPRISFLQEEWNSFKSEANETLVSGNIGSEQFWDILRNSLEDGTFYNRVANYQTPDNRMGGELFLQTIYASILQIPVMYKSVTPDGDSVWLSGKIFLPRNKKAKNIIIANHYTICADSEAPSNACCIEGIFATKDYIVLMPDYLGYGISSAWTHPYLHLESTVRSAVDMLKAAIPYLQYNLYTYSPSLILIGYSQGAAATLALQKTLEEQYASQFLIKKVFAGGGPYDLTGTYDYYTSREKMAIPCAMPMLLLGIDYGEHLGLKCEDFFQPFLLNNYRILIESKNITMNEVNARLGSDINKLFKPVIARTDTFPASVLYEALKRNSILHWTPKSPMVLFHSTEDNMVPFLNSRNIKNEFDGKQSGYIRYDFAPYGNHMRAAVYFFEKVYKSL